MTTIPHRELRNQSSKILERVKNGETIDVTNNGEVAATLIPPSASPLERLLLSGQVRPAAKGARRFPALPRVSSERRYGGDPGRPPRGPLIIYLDTSAVLKLVVEEAESAACRSVPVSGRGKGHRLVASMLLYTELHCAAHRRGFPGAPVNAVLGAINLVDVARSDLMYAAALPGKLRSADAIHLAAAIRLQSDVLVAYDSELLAAAVEAGLDVLSPGA